LKLQSYIYSTTLVDQKISNNTGTRKNSTERISSSPRHVVSIKFIFNINDSKEETYKQLLHKMSHPAKDLVNQANNILTKYIYFGDRNYDAIELFNRAVNLYKLEKNYILAGYILIKVGECYLDMKDSYSGADCFKSAAECFREYSVNESISALRRAVDLYLNAENIRQAAECMKLLGDVYEKQDQIPKCIECYKKAADYFEADFKTHSRFECLIKVAHLEATLGNYKEAITIFEQCAGDDRIQITRVREYLFKAILCSIADLKHFQLDINQVKDKMSQFELTHSFNTGREYTKIHSIFAAIDKRDKLALKKNLFGDKWDMIVMNDVVSKMSGSAEGNDVDYFDDLDLT
jgi:tetratricopeptide (TPR) repeat protein